MRLLRQVRPFFLDEQRSPLCANNTFVDLGPTGRSTRVPCKGDPGPFVMSGIKPAAKPADCSDLGGDPA